MRPSAIVLLACLLISATAPAAEFSWSPGWQVRTYFVMRAPRFDYLPTPDGGGSTAEPAGWNYVRGVVTTLDAGHGGAQAVIRFSCKANDLWSFDEATESVDLRLDLLERRPLEVRRSFVDGDDQPHEHEISWKRRSTYFLREGFGSALPEDFFIFLPRVAPATIASAPWVMGDLSWSDAPGEPVIYSQQVQPTANGFRLTAWTNDDAVDRVPAKQFCSLVFVDGMPWPHAVRADGSFEWEVVEWGVLPQQ